MTPFVTAFDVLSSLSAQNQMTVALAYESWDKDFGTLPDSGRHHPLSVDQVVKYHHLLAPPTSDQGLARRATRHAPPAFRVVETHPEYGTVRIVEPIVYHASDGASRLESVSVPLNSAATTPSQAEIVQGGFDAINTEMQRLTELREQAHEAFLGGTGDLIATLTRLLPEHYNAGRNFLYSAPQDFKERERLRKEVGTLRANKGDPEEIARLTAQIQRIEKGDPLQKTELDREVAEICAQIERGIFPGGDDLEALASRLGYFRFGQVTGAVRKLLELNDAAKELVTTLMGRIGKYQETQLALGRKADSLISWTIHQAVWESATDLKAYYQHIALAWEFCQEQIELDAVLRDDLRRITEQVVYYETGKIRYDRGQVKNFYQALDRRRQQFERTTLPPEQKGRGHYYHIADELHRLGLQDLMGKLPDRLPLPPREDSTIDAIYTTGDFDWQAYATRFYDLALRTAVLIQADGDVKDSDEAVVVLSHGISTNNSTLESLLVWMNLLTRNYEGQGGETPNAQRRLSVVGYGQPGHDFGSRDPRMVEKDPVQSADVTGLDPKIQSHVEALAHPETATDYLSAIQDRYAPYRSAQRPLIRGGRSTDGYLSRIHRALAPQDQQFDGYISMSAYPADSIFWLSYSIFMIRALINGSETNSVNPWGYEWGTRLQYSLAQMDMQVTDPNAPPVLNMIGGKDVDYAVYLPSNLDPTSPEAKDWIEFHAQRTAEYSQLSRGLPLEALKPKALGYLRDFLIATRQWIEKIKDPTETVEEYWAEFLRTHPASLAQAWQDDHRQDPQSILYEDPDAYHNMIAGKLHSPETVQNAVKAMLDFIRLVRGNARR